MLFCSLPHSLRGLSAQTPYISTLLPSPNQAVLIWFEMWLVCGADMHWFYLHLLASERKLPFWAGWAGVKWMWELHTQRAGGIVGDEMGLGKTVQARL